MAQYDAPKTTRRLIPERPGQEEVHWTTVLDSDIAAGHKW